MPRTDYFIHAKGRQLQVATIHKIQLQEIPPKSWVYV